MNSHLVTLRETIIAENAAANPDFDFRLAFDQKEELRVDYWGIWETERPRGEHEISCFTVGHDGECFLVKRYSYIDRKKYKTLKGAVKYINSEITNYCERKRKEKMKNDAKKEFAEKSIQLLREFQGILTKNGIKSKLCLTADRYNFDHLNVEAVRIKTDIDITVTSDYRLEMSLSYQRFYAAPDDAIDIISTLAKKGTA